MCVCVCVPAEPVALIPLCIPLTTRLPPAGGNEGNHHGDQLGAEGVGKGTVYRRGAQRKKREGERGGIREDGEGRDICIISTACPIVHLQMSCSSTTVGEGVDWERRGHEQNGLFFIFLRVSPQ